MLQWLNPPEILWNCKNTEEKQSEAEELAYNTQTDTPPEVTNVKIYGDMKEGNTITVSGTVTGGTEDSSTVQWFTSDSAFLGGENDLKELGPSTISKVYNIPLGAVGKFILAKFTPMNPAGEAGEPVLVTSETVVTALPPSLESLSIMGNFVEGGILKASYGYVGGYEGKSIYNWYIHKDENDRGNPKPEFFGHLQYKVCKSDVGKYISFGCTPVRIDGISGKETFSIVVPPKEGKVWETRFQEKPRIERLSFIGNAVEGEVLTAREIIPESEIQKNVWKWYMKEVRYQWFCSFGNGNYQFFKPIPSQCSPSYKPRFEDIGRYLRCESIVMDVFGRMSDPVYAKTDAVLPGIPKIDNLEIEGRGFHTNSYAVRGSYSGGKEGESRIQWFRSKVGSRKCTAIPGETGRTYEAIVDDVGLSLVAIYTPIREDGIEGQPVSASTERIAVEPDVLKEVKEKLHIGSVKFEVLFDEDHFLRKMHGTQTPVRRILEVNRERVKVVKPGLKLLIPRTEIRASYAPPFHVKVFRDDQLRLRILVDGDREVDLMVQTPHLRDVIVLLIRGFALLQRDV